MVGELEIETVNNAEKVMVNVPHEVGHEESVLDAGTVSVPSEETEVGGVADGRAFEGVSLVRKDGVS